MKAPLLKEGILYGSRCTSPDVTRPARAWRTVKLFHGINISRLWLSLRVSFAATDISLAREGLVIFFWSRKETVRSRSALSLRESNLARE